MKQQIIANRNIVKSLCCELNAEAANTNCMVFGLS